MVTRTPISNNREKTQHDTKQAVEFLRNLFSQKGREKGPYTLTSIVPDGATTTKQFWPGDEEEMHRWIERRQGRENVYYHANLCHDNVTSKAKKTDIAKAVGFQVDTDRRVGYDRAEEDTRILTGLESFKPPPSVIVATGNGYQGRWLLGQWIPLNSTEDIESVEAVNRYIRDKLEGADNCQDVSRLLRLPGTINLPTKKKLERGCTEEVARVQSHYWKRVYKLEDFGSVPSKSDKPLPKFVAGGELVLPPGVPSWVRTVILTGDRSDGRYGNTSKTSAATAAVIWVLLDHWDDEAIRDLISDPRYPISAYCRKSANPDEAQRQIDRVRGNKEAAAKKWQRDKKTDKIVGDSQTNIRTALSEMGVTLSYDRFADQVIIAGPDGRAARTVDDHELDALYLEIDERYWFRPTDKFFYKVIPNEARRDSFHPVCDMLATFQAKWDGKKRTDTWLIDLAGAEDTPFVRAVSRMVLMAAVRRVRQPGCKFDEMLVLIDPTQGGEKSGALATLAMHDEWFADDLPLGAKSREVIEQTFGKWIIEASELKGIHDKGFEHLKAFLSRQYDRARQVWHRTVTDRPRHFIIIGTTNETQFLRDLTGNRRYWPVTVSEFDLKKLKRDREQLWGEAAYYEAQGESIRLPRHLWGAAAEAQNAAMIEEPWVELVREAFVDSDGNPINGKIRSADVWHIVNVPEERRTQVHKARLGSAMQKNGWTWKQRRFGGHRLESAYIRGDDYETQHVIVTAHRDPNGSLVIKAGNDDGRPVYPRLGGRETGTKLLIH